MSVTTSFPGIYIQELPSNAHAITAAPTSVTVFVGYSHPFKTPAANFGTPIELFSFADYEREFGGFAPSTIFDNNLPYAVSQFFLNGGGDAVVVGLQPKEYFPSATTISPQTGTFAISAKDIIFTSLEPTDSTPMVLAIKNVNENVADLSVTNREQQEVHRKISLDNTSADYLETRINGLSSLVTVAPGSTGYPTAFTGVTSPQTIQSGGAAGDNTTFATGDFTAVFQADTPLDKWPIFNLMVIPGITDAAVMSEAVALCERKLAFLIMDPPSADVADQTSPNYIGNYAPPLSQNAALYFPYIVSNDPTTGAPVNLPPSGTVAGIYARTDVNRGVWKAPAGLEPTILNTTGVVPGGVMNDQRQGVFNNLAIDCLRTFPGVGTVVFGARTLAYPNVSLRTQWGYVPVRRMALFLEQTLLQNLKWFIFEPNDDPLWVAIRVSIESFMLSLFHQGAFAGTTPTDSFQVKCDSSTTTQQDIDNGQVNIIVAFAPLKPSEFVIVKIAQLAGQAQT